MSNPERSSILLITGTSRGIGHYLANYYLARNCVIIGCSRSASDITHANYLHFSIDLSNEQALIELFREIRKKYGRLDILINNAAINPTISPAALIPTETMLECLKTNLLAPMVLCREACKLMARNKFGRIINIGSMAAKLKVRGESVYATTKAALHTYTEVLAKEVYKHNITVNVVAPSAIDTELSAQIDQIALNNILSQNAVPHFGQMRDVSNAIDWLTSEESDSITGQIIYLGGV